MSELQIVQNVTEETKYDLTCSAFDSEGKYTIVSLYDEFEGDSNLFFCTNPMEVDKAVQKGVCRFRIRDFVSETFFFDYGRCVRAYFRSEKEIKLKEYLTKSYGEKDKLFKALVIQCENVVASDIEKFYLCRKVVNFEELKEVNSFLAKGSSLFPPDYSFIRARFGIDGIESKYSKHKTHDRIFLQIAENDRIQHIELTPELFALSKVSKVRKHFEKIFK